jgi:hypothetical protein
MIEEGLDVTETEFSRRSMLITAAVGSAAVIASQTLVTSTPAQAVVEGDNFDCGF